MITSRSWIIICLSCLLFLSACDKNNASPRRPDDTGIPSDNTPYVSYYVVNNRTVSNIRYLTASNVGEFTLSRDKDTSSFHLMFSNESVQTDDFHTNDWLLCDSVYDVTGLDEFDLICRWTGDSTAKLTVGKTYNLNEIRDGKSLSAPESEGYAVFYHRHANLSLITTLSSTVAITDPQPQNSYLIINRVENNTASGTFTLAFRCSPDNNANTRYVNYVKGVFNKVPIQL